MLTDTADVQTADHISGSGDPAPTDVGSSALAPTAAHGTRLRRVVLLDYEGAARLIVEEPDHSCVARLADRLSLLRAQVLRCVVERLADVAFRTREGVGDLAGGFVQYVLH